MKFRSMLCALLVCLGLGNLALPAFAQEPGEAVYCIGAENFADQEDLAGICITEVPPREVGLLMLGDRQLQPGDVLTIRQAAEMTFHPADQERNQQTAVTYLPIYDDRVETAEVMSIAVAGRRNQAPVAEDSALETYRNLPNEGLLKVKDPEGKPMTFVVTRLPRRGSVVVREDGSFVYTPKKNKVGVDSFAYTATDEAGNVSREATVTVTILKPSDRNQYSDTVGKSCRFAAEWMKNTGIFISENINGNGCFQPEKQVSRGEFLTMLVGALGLAPEENGRYTGFADEAPAWLQPYLATALRCGLTVGWPGGDTFGYAEPITGAEAAVIIQNALDLRPETGASGETVPAWAAEAMCALRDHGIALESGEILTRGRTAELMYRIRQMKENASGMGPSKSA